MPVLRGLYDNVGTHRRLTAKGRALSLLGVLLLVGAALSVFNVPLASSAASGIQVMHTSTTATDPQSPLWDKAPEAAIALSSQQIYEPGGGSTREVRVRSMEDGKTIAFRVSWDDDTRNDIEGPVPSDAAAIELPIDPTHLPYQCMGQSSNRVNIWQWKAVLEREQTSNEGALALENAGVLNLTSNGICRAAATPGVAPHVKSYHDGKQWHVVFYRELADAGAGTAPLHTTVNTSAAFAVWNGAKGEVRGMKAVSTWNAVTFAAAAPSNTGNLITLGVIVALSVAVVAFSMRRLSA